MDGFLEHVLRHEAEPAEQMVRFAGAGEEGKRGYSYPRRQNGHTWAHAYACASLGSQAA